MRPGSPAEVAGIEVGDRIVAVDGDRDYDPLRLPSITASKAGEPTPLIVVRGGEERTVEVTPNSGASWTPTVFPDSPLGVDAIGLAMAVSPVIAEVRDDSPAARAGLKAGQTIMAVDLTRPADDGEKQKTQTVTLGDEYSWPYLFDLFQRGAFARIALHVSEVDRPVPLKPVPVADWSFPDRGLQLMPDQAPLPPMPMGDAVGRAGIETVDAITSFYTLLRRLFERRVGTSGVSGPIGIAGAAFHYAGVNLAEFLWFIGFISLNLAVVNFLPIPPLDGGRMVFLIGEAVRGRPLPESWQGPAHLRRPPLFALPDGVRHRPGRSEVVLLRRCVRLHT